jgi:hypothetical protein
VTSLTSVPSTVSPALFVEEDNDVSSATGSVDPSGIVTAGSTASGFSTGAFPAPGSEEEPRGEWQAAEITAAAISNGDENRRIALPPKSASPRV